MVFHPPDASAEAQVRPGILCAGIGAAIDIDLQVGQLVKIQPALLQFATDTLDQTLWQTDAQTASVGTCARGQVVEDDRKVKRQAQPTEELIDIRQIRLGDVAELHVLAGRKADDVVAEWLQEIGYLSKHLR